MHPATAHVGGVNTMMPNRFPRSVIGEIRNPKTAPAMVRTITGREISMPRILPRREDGGKANSRAWDNEYQTSRQAGVRQSGFLIESRIVSCKEATKECSAPG